MGDGLKRACAAAKRTRETRPRTTVRVGQVWQDTDPRNKERGGVGVRRLTVLTNDKQDRKVLCRSFWEGGLPLETRRVRIARDRLERGEGYRLVTEAG